MADSQYASIWHEADHWLTCSDEEFKNLIAHADVSRLPAILTAIKGIPGRTNQEQTRFDELASYCRPPELFSQARTGSDTDFYKCLASTDADDCSAVLTGLHRQQGPFTGVMLNRIREITIHRHLLRRDVRSVQEQLELQPEHWPEGQEQDLMRLTLSSLKDLRELACEKMMQEYVA
jgi:hypothetical protein